MAPLFERVTIIGAGLVGGSLGLALRQRGLAEHVFGVGHRQVSIDRAVAMGAITEGGLEPVAGVKDADLVVLGTAIGLISEIGEHIADRLKPGAILTDLGSTKSEIVKRLEAVTPEGVHFVGAHPIAGSEKRGIAAASAALFEGRTCVITPTERTNPEAERRVAEMWKAVGSRVAVLSPEEHDAILARTSHLPHLAAAALIAQLQTADERFVGSGIRDTTRVASGDVNIWCDIVLTNRDAVLDALEHFTARVAEFRDAVLRGDRDALAALLSAPKRRRDRLWPDGSSHE